MTEQSPTLHSLVCGYADEPEDLARQRLAQITALLDAGADPNEENEHEMTPLAVLADGAAIWAGGFSLVVAEDIVRLLIHRGANPLAKDRPIGKCNSDTMARVMVRDIIDMEAQGRGLRGEEGSNVLHVLAEDNLDLLGTVLRWEETPIPNTWLNETRHSDGATALHAMWGDGGIIVGYMENDMDYDEYVAPAWKCMQRLVEKGADLMIKDAKGQRAANVISNAVVGEGFPVEEGYEDFWGQVQSFATRETLDERTSAARGKPRSKRI